MSRPRPRKWTRYNYEELTPEFFALLSERSNLTLDDAWRENFTSWCTSAHAAWGGSDASFVRDSLRWWKQNRIFERELLRLFCLAGGRLRGSWGSDGRTLDGPMFRFLRTAYPALPEVMRPRTPEALCRRCHCIAREVRKSMRADPQFNKNNVGGELS
jgi:hypothetical protein